MQDRKILLLILLAAAAAVSAAGDAAISHVRAQSLQQQLAELKQDPQKVAQQETQALLDRVGNLIVLPEGETPTIATVSDPEKLKNQPFFAKAKVGDKVLIYTNARKAILYDPVADRILEVAPINIGPAEVSNPVTPPTP